MALPPLPWEDLTDSREDRAELHDDSPDLRQDSQTGLTWQPEVRGKGGAVSHLTLTIPTASPPALPSLLAHIHVGVHVHRLVPQVERLPPFLHLHLLLVLQSALQGVAGLGPGSSQSPVNGGANKPLKPFQVKVGQAVGGLENKFIKRQEPSVMSG